MNEFLGLNNLYYFYSYIYFIVSFRYRSLLQPTLSPSQSIQIQQSFHHTFALTLSTSTWVVALIPSTRKRLHFLATVTTSNFGVKFSAPPRLLRSLFTPKSIVRILRVSLTWQGFWCIWGNIFSNFWSLPLLWIRFCFGNRKERCWSASERISSASDN